MSSQGFEILCPVCRSVVPQDAARCPNCEGRKRREAASGTARATTLEPALTKQSPPPPPDLRALPMRDYHRVVRATYQATERTPGISNGVRAYLPFVVLVLLLIVGAGLLYGHI